MNMGHANMLASKGRRALFIGLLTCLMATPAIARPQLSLDELKARFSQAKAETDANVAKAKDLRDKGDMAGACTSWNMALASLKQKADSLRQIGDAIRDESRLTADQKKSITDEEAIAREGIVGLEGYIKHNCAAATGNSLSLAEMIDKAKNIDRSAQQHLKDGLALMRGNEKIKGCVEILHSLADHQSFLDLTIKLKVTLEKDELTQPDTIVQLQLSIGELQEKITNISSYISNNCPSN